MSQIRTSPASLPLLVAADGKSEIQMLDEQGRVSKSITPGTKE